MRSIPVCSTRRNHRRRSWWPQSGTLTAAEIRKSGRGDAQLLGRRAQQEEIRRVSTTRPRLREVGLGVGDGELVCGLLVDEPLVKQPLNRPALGANIPQGVPRRDQLGVVFIYLALESSEGSPSLQRPCQLSASGRSLMPSAKSAMSWYQT